MALTRLTPERMQEAIVPYLEEGEVVLASAFGIKMPSRETVKKLLIYGVVVIGLFILQMMQDKVYLVLTNRRVLVIVLLERFYKPLECIALARGDVHDFVHEKGSMYHNVDFMAGDKAYRFKFFPAPMGLPANGEAVLRIVGTFGGASRG